MIKYLECVDETSNIIQRRISNRIYKYKYYGTYNNILNTTLQTIVIINIVYAYWKLSSSYKAKSNPNFI
jgi:hypothetical protein